MKDVADAAGLSPITVWRALHQSDMVKPSTRERVTKALEQVGYVPNLVARSLVRERSQIVAAIVPTITNSIFADMIAGVSDLLAEHRYQLLLGNSGYDQSKEENLIRAFLGRRADGLVLTGAMRTLGSEHLLRRANIPVVETWNIGRKRVDMVVGFSNYRAGYEMTRFLAGKGYRKIAFVSGPTTGNDRAIERRKGYRAALREMGCPKHGELILETQLGFVHGAAALRTLIDRHPDIDAIWFTGDVLAAGALFECQRSGWPVPRRVAIVGMGDLEIASQTIPKLTTLRIPSYEIGRDAAQMIISKLDGKKLKSRVIDHGFRIIERESA